MKINLPNEEDGFRKYEHVFCNRPAYLIIPEVDAKWNKHNLHFRSMVTDMEGYVLSCGFPKFFNYGEKPDCYPDPEKHKYWSIEEKIDGSLVICDFVNGQFNMRTRGAVSYKTQENWKDFELLPKKYPKILEYFPFDQDLTLLFEIVTPNNVIVIRPEDIDFYFLGAIDKETLTVLSYENTEQIWNVIGRPKLPERFNFDKIKDLKTLSEKIKSWKGKEGIVVSYNNNQNKIKIKSDWYCWIHKIKSQLNSENNLIEYYVDLGMPEYQDFYTKVETDFDFELANQLKSQISKMADAGERVEKIVEGMKKFVSSLKFFETRKQQAEHTLDSYGNTNRASFVFTLLDGKELSKDQLVKLMHQSL
jgi:T4 RnlA family RNA ligase